MKFSIPDDPTTWPKNTKGARPPASSAKLASHQSPGEGHGSHMAGGGGSNAVGGPSISPTGKTTGPAGAFPADFKGSPPSKGLKVSPLKSPHSGAPKPYGAP
jgi:hypothetical protein